MRRLLLALLFLVVTAAPSAAAITEVGAGSQRNSTSGSAVTSVDIAYPGNVTAGDLVIISGAVWNTVGLTAPTGSTKAGSTATVGSYTTLFGSTGVAVPPGTGYAYIIYGIVTGSGSLTVTVTASAGSTYIEVACDEFAGVNATPLDVDGGEATGGPSGPGTDVATDSIVTITANDLVVGAIALSGSVGAWTAGTNYTLFGNDPLGAVQPYATEFAIFAGAAGSKTVSWTWTVSAQSWSQINAAFKETGSATRQKCIGCGIDKKIIGDR